MYKCNVVYLPIGRTTFDLAAGEVYRKMSSDWLENTCNQVYQPEKILTSVEELEEFLKSIQGYEIDTLLYQSITFADGEFMTKALEYLKQPVVVWSVREPSMGGRLRLNSLTGGNSTCHVLHGVGRPYAFVLGNPDEKQLQERLLRSFEVHRVIGKLQQLKVGMIGEHPPGFYFSGVQEEKLQQAFGIQIQPIDLHDAFHKSSQVPMQQWKETLEQAQDRVSGIDHTDSTVQKFAQFTTYVRNYIQEHQIQAVAIRCWPDFFNEFGAAACSTLSHLTEEGWVSSCESDLQGSISMLILRELSGGKAPYLGDLVHVCLERQTVVFWHCGAGAYSLANSATGAQAGVHPNRKMGLTMEFGLKPGAVTIFRLGSTPTGYRLLVMTGEALDTPQPFSGTSVEVKLHTNDVHSTVNELMQQGFEPHYALVYADVAPALIELGRLMGIETIVYAS